MLKIPKVNKLFIPPAWASEAQLKKKKFFVCGKTSFYFHQRQLAVAKIPNTKFLDLKIDQGSARQCHSSAHFDLRCVLSVWAGGESGNDEGS
jgi:hypothetical protein